MTPRRAFGAFAGGVAVALALVSCGEPSLGTGVVLWSDGGAVAAGTVVDVVEESTIEDRYLVRAAAADRRQAPVPVAPRWRVRVFSDPAAAAEFAGRFADFVNVYAYAVRRGLPVRAEASATAGIVYKLREQEVVKVTGRGAEPERVGAFENYWYGVLTEDGTEGYTYGEFLPLFESLGDPHAEAARLQADDPGLDRVLGTAWRPEEFLSMANRRRFDLLRLRPEYGLFPDPAARVFRLVTAQREREFPYRAVERVGDGRYVLAAAGGDGSPARFTLRGNGALAFSYVDDGRLITEVFVDLQDEVEELIAAEQARRARRFAALLERGPLLRSGGYGTIELTAEGRFRWHGYAALVPRWVPDGLPGTGVVDFRYALAASLRGSYDVAVTLLFDAPRPAARAAPPGGAQAGSGAAAGGVPGGVVGAGATRGAAAGVGTPGTGAGLPGAVGADADGSAGPGAAAGAGAGTTGMGADAAAGSAGAPGAADGGAATAGAAGGTGPDSGAGPGTAVRTAQPGAGPDQAGTGTTGMGADAAAGSGGVAGSVAGSAATAGAAGGTGPDFGAEAGDGARGRAGAGPETAVRTAQPGTGTTGMGADAAAGSAGAPGTAAGGAATAAAAGGAASARPAATGAAGTAAAGSATAAGGPTGGGDAARAEASGGGDHGAGATVVVAGSDPETDSDPEYMRPIPWAAELTLLASYDGAGVRLTPVEPAAAALEVRQVSRSAVVMYFAAPGAGGG